MGSVLTGSEWITWFSSSLQFSPSGTARRQGGGTKTNKRNEKQSKTKKSHKQRKQKTGQFRPTLSTPTPSRTSQLEEVKCYKAKTLLSRPYGRGLLFVCGWLLLRCLWTMWIGSSTLGLVASTLGAYAPPDFMHTPRRPDIFAWEPTTRNTAWIISSSQYQASTWRWMHSTSARLRI